ncbi:hypothetical protein [Rhodococcus sp. 077-4]|uniref:hypothetical protein n=1 Tax=Rhodococcus sp. 077-4 TaxID=2789271 RepID=UPI0039F61E8B
MPRTHRTEDATRDLVSDAVIEYVAEHGIGVQPEIPMERILETAGVSRASAYRIWPGRSAFGAFAIEQCAAGNTLESLTHTRAIALARRALDVETDPVHCAAYFVALCADEELTLLLASPRWRAFVCFQAVATGTSAELLRTALERADSEDIDRLTHFYRYIADAWGLENYDDDGERRLAETALLISRSTAARIVVGKDEADARRGYASSLTALVRGTFRARPTKGHSAKKVLDAVNGWAGLQ